MANRRTRQERIRQAMRVDQENERLLTRGVREAVRPWRQIQDDLAEQAYRGRDIAPLVNGVLTEQRQGLADAMLFYYLRGMKIAVQNAEGHKSGTFNLAYEQEIKDLTLNVPLTEAELAAITADMTVEARRLLTMTGTALEERIAKAVRRSVDKGLIKRDAIKEIKKSLKNSGLITKPYQIESIYRTSANMSFNAGRWDANQNPAIQSVLWGFEYVTVGDILVRPEHAALNGTRAEKDSRIWSWIWPPNGWNCRCSTIEIYTDEVELAHAVQPQTGWGVDKGFAVNFGETLTAA